jgi:rod shape-determining protein MreB
MIVDIGGGTTDVAVLSLSGVVESSSIKAAGEAFDDAVVKYIRRKHNVLIGDSTAEELKKSIGCVFPRPETTSVDVKGRCLLTGLPRVVSITTSEILDAFGEVSERILEMIHHVLENTPPELVADISQNGIVLTGGGSLLWGFDKLIESRTNIPTRISDDAELCVGYGIGKSLDLVGDMHEGTINLARRRQMKA